MHHHHHQSNFDHLNRGGRIYPSSNLSNSHSPSRSIHGALFLQPTLLLSLSIYIFHVFFACPGFLLPRTSNSNGFLRTCPSSLLNTCLYHLTLFAVSFNPNISISSFVLFFSISFAPHIALTIALSVLLKIAISFSLTHHVSLPCNTKMCILRSAMFSKILFILSPQVVL